MCHIKIHYLWPLVISKLHFIVQVRENCKVLCSKNKLDLEKNSFESLLTYFDGSTHFENCINYDIELYRKKSYVLTKQNFPTTTLPKQKFEICIYILKIYRCICMINYLFQILFCRS